MNKAIFCACQRSSASPNAGIDNRDVFTTAKDELNTSVVEFLANQVSQLELGFIEIIAKDTYKELDGLV